MLEIAQNEGIAHIIATPHYEAHSRSPGSEELQSKLELVRQEAKKINENFRIDLGNELFYSDDIVEHLKQKKALTLAGTRYVLVEFTFSESYQNMRTGLYKFLMNGYLPILAHVERYECLYRRVDYINDLIKLGAFMQMNISSILGSITNQRSRFCKRLLKNDCIHFIGTDSHSDHHRAPKMREGVSFISKKYGDGLVHQLLIENTAKLLNNKQIYNMNWPTSEL
jgi:protein-tyrosine phosphatase